MRPANLTPRLVLAAILAFGIAPIWIFGVTVILESLMSTDHSSGSLWVRSDGTPLLAYYTSGRSSVEYMDLAGKPVEVPLGEEPLNFVDLLRVDENPDRAAPPDWRQRIRSFTDTRNQPTYWYLMSDGQRPGSAYFVGYNAINNRRVGYLGLQGFRTEPLSPAEHFALPSGQSGLHYRVASQQFWYQSAQFPTSYQAQSFTADHEFAAWNVYLAADDDRVYQIDLKDRSVKPVLSMPNLRSCQLYFKTNKGPTFLAVCNDRELLLLDDKHEVKRRYALTDILPDKRTQWFEGAFRWAEIEPGKAIAYWTDNTSLPAERFDRIVWFDEAGKISRRETVLRSHMQVPLIEMAFVVPVPLLDFIGVCWIYPWELLSQGRVETWSQAIARSLDDLWPMLVAVSILSTIFAVLCYLRLVRYAASPTERIVWTAFVWICGWPGWLAFRFGQRWPVLERCSHCGRVVPRDQVACARCEREFSRPAPQGIEILAS